MVKTVASQGQLGKHMTTIACHSHSQYGVTNMFTAKVPEKIIMEQSGH